MANPTSQSSLLPSADLSIGAWSLDPAASRVRIQHKSMWGLVNVKGTFTKLSGEGELLPNGSAHGTLSVDAASIDTKNVKRDVHLRSADFFDVDNHPRFTFTADSATADSAGTAKVTGHLTVLDTTRPLEFTAQVAATTATDVTLTGEVAVDRYDFGMGWNKGGMIKGLTTVTLTLRFTRR